MIFKNRQQAGQRLALKLKEFQSDGNVIVLALPRGGVITGAAIANSLDLPMDILVSRKIGAPFNKEFAIGAVTPEGEFINNETAENIGIPPGYIISETAKEKTEARRRLELYRQGNKPLILKEKTVILVDDGIATGLTMKAAIMDVKKAGAGKVIIATPVIARDTYDELEKLTDEVICLDSPRFFGAVGAFYDDFEQINDSQVLQAIKQAKA